MSKKRAGCRQQRVGAADRSFRLGIVQAKFGLTDLSLIEVILRGPVLVPEGGFEPLFGISQVGEFLPRGLAASHCREPQPFRHRPNMIR